jgi:hypothetical protein
MVFMLLVWLLSGMHGCDLHSLWIELPMLFCFLVVLPFWTRRGTTLGQMVLRSVAIVVFAVLLEWGYLSLLHSGHFPRWLLLPRPRIEGGIPEREPAATPRTAASPTLPAANATNAP